VLEGVRACQRALRGWDRRRGLGLVTAELERLVQLAEGAGAACKISGAGGGDSVVALAESPRLEEVARRWREEGFVPFWPRASGIGVQEGQRVARGEPVGASGQTGMAGGDHLHFAMLVGGTFVSPAEWYDGHWIADNVANKLAQL
jgi:hypothetical protein